MLTRFVYGVISHSLGSLVAFFEGVAIFHYSDSLGVSLEFRGLGNFVIGALAAYTAVIAGNLSDQAKTKYRRKTYVLIFAPLFAFGVLARMCAFTSDAGAPTYYVITYAMQIVGSTGLSVVTEAWGVELASTVTDRNKLYTMATFCGLAGIFIGIPLNLFPLWLGGIIGATLVMGSTFCAIRDLPDNTPLTKRSFIPLMASSIDYDELMCNKKRASSYAGVVIPLRLFITIAGTSVPLALMSALGFKSPSDDENDGNDGDDGNSSYGSTIVLRIWCSIFISFCMLGAYIVLRNYKVFKCDEVFLNCDCDCDCVVPMYLYSYDINLLFLFVYRLLMINTRRYLTCCL